MSAGVNLFPAWLSVPKGSFSPQTVGEKNMAATTVSCSFDKDAVWKKVCRRKPVVLDMNAWINMADDKSDLATRVKGTLRKLVSDGVIFCPLSFGLICELYRQAEDSRLRVGTLMEGLSLNVSYASKEDIFAWEVERCVRRLADAGPIDLSDFGLYVPVAAYLASNFHLTFPEDSPAARVEEAVKMVNDRANSLTFTELLQLRAANETDDIFNFAKSFPSPDLSEERKRIWDSLKGNREKILRNETESVFRLYVKPAMDNLPPPVKARFIRYLPTAPKDKYGGVLGELLKYLPSIQNHIEVMAAVSQNPARRDKGNDFFDFEVIPVPLAYASVFVAQDKGIRDMLRNRTRILERSDCRYCFDLTELEEWLETLVRSR
jgi:hypothetical protein